MALGVWLLWVIRSRRAVLTFAALFLCVVVWWILSRAEEARPFQGCLPTRLSGSVSVEVHGQHRLTLRSFGVGHLGWFGILAAARCSRIVPTVPTVIQFPGAAVINAPLVINAPFRSRYLRKSQNPTPQRDCLFNRNPAVSYLRPALASGDLPSLNPWPVLCKHRLCDCDQLLNALPPAQPHATAYYLVNDYLV